MSFPSRAWNNHDTAILTNLCRNNVPLDTIATDVLRRPYTDALQKVDELIANGTVTARMSAGAPSSSSSARNPKRPRQENESSSSSSAPPPRLDIDPMLLSCKACFEPYDGKQHMPVRLVCGHDGYCNKCAPVGDIVDKCIRCNEPKKVISFDYALREVAEAYNKQLTESLAYKIVAKWSKEKTKKWLRDELPTLIDHWDGGASDEDDPALRGVDLVYLYQKDVEVINSFLFGYGYKGADKFMQSMSQRLKLRLDELFAMTDEDELDTLIVDHVVSRTLHPRMVPKQRAQLHDEQDSEVQVVDT